MILLFSKNNNSSPDLSILFNYRNYTDTIVLAKHRAKMASTLRALGLILNDYDTLDLSTNKLTG